MSRPAQYALLLAALLLAAFVGWRIVATRTSDSLATSAPRESLAWDAGNPEARLALAQQQLEHGDPDQAAATARELLRNAPLQADAFTVLARAAAARGESDRARQLFGIALRRAPRNPYARAWMIGDELQHGDYPAALHNVDVLFGFAPQQRTALIPLLAQVASRQSDFASALGQHLAQRPRWRDAMLDEMLAHAPAVAIDNVFGTLQSAAGGLSDNEAGRWFARLEQDGEWGEAYSRWVSRVGIDTRQGVPLVFNGSFERPPTGIGFDWVMRGEPGVEIERVRIAGASGDFAAQVTFRRRRANDMGFQQTLLLAPGHYSLSFRARADNLRSDRGLAWDIVCVSGGTPIASSPRLDGSFDWKTVNTDFSVPASNCPAQRLLLANPGAGGSAKVVSGTLWFDDFKVVPVASPPPSGTALDSSRLPPLLQNPATPYP
jgi:tetratricopeptide (TPR) repeat protein